MRCSARTHTCTHAVPVSPLWAQFTRGSASPYATLPPTTRRHSTQTRAQQATPIPVDGAFHSGSTAAAHRVQVWSFEAVQDQTYVRPTANLAKPSSLGPATR